MPSPRKPRVRARLAGPSGLAAALALGAAGPANAAVHRAAVAGPGGGWDPTVVKTATDSPIGALAVLGACGLAGFLLLLLGRRKDVDDPVEMGAVPPDLEAMMRRTRSGPDRAPGTAAGTGSPASATGSEGGPPPIWVKRLNDQAPPPPPAEPSRIMDSAYRG
jgi:hypothetical protein